MRPHTTAILVLVLKPFFPGLQSSSLPEHFKNQKTSLHQTHFSHLIPQKWEIAPGDDGLPSPSAPITEKQVLTPAQGTFWAATTRQPGSSTCLVPWELFEAAGFRSHLFTLSPCCSSQSHLKLHIRTKGQKNTCRHHNVTLPGRHQAGGQRSEPRAVRQQNGQEAQAQGRMPPQGQSQLGESVFLSMEAHFLENARCHESYASKSQERPRAGINTVWTHVCRTRRKLLPPCPQMFSPGSPSPNCKGTIPHLFYDIMWFCCQETPAPVRESWAVIKDSKFRPPEILQVKDFYL